jgi:hypothetical protein
MMGWLDPERTTKDFDIESLQKFGTEFGYALADWF